MRRRAPSLGPLERRFAQTVDGEVTMLSSPYRSVVHSYPASKLPPEVRGGIDPSANVRIVLALLDDEGYPVNRHLFSDRPAGEPASVETIDDYVRWMRGD